MAKKKKLRLRYEAKKFLSYFIFFLILAIYALSEGSKIYKHYQYQKTDEYKLINNEYSKKQTSYILKNTNKKIIEFLIENPHDKNYYLILTEKYYLEKNFNKYIEYYQKYPSLEINRIIARVNVGSNESWYNNPKETDISQNNLMLVNKYHYLKEDFSRTDLKNISLQYSYNGNIASEETILQFEKMYKDVKNELGINLMVNSSYRSYQEQDEIYREFKIKGEEYADSYAARPGYSEHQTGLAIDITSTAHPTSKAFTDSEEYKWLKENSYKYGFILRYPEGKEDITGYNTESWHFRYVGVKDATKIYNEDITFDEYYAYYIEK